MTVGGSEPPKKEEEEKSKDNAEGEEGPSPAKKPKVDEKAKGIIKLYYYNFLPPLS